MLENTSNIIENLLSLAQEKGVSIGKTKLIKLIYLAELEFYRRNNNRLLNEDWQYYIYGPYIYSIEKYLQGFNIHVQGNDNSEYQKITIYNKQNVPPVSSELKVMLMSIVSKFGKMELNDLLNYVYFETEPMMNVSRKGEQLDFSTIKPKTYYDKKKFKDIEQVKKEVQLNKERLENVIKL
jgi:uncharacterized phage-associated protein